MLKIECGAERNGKLHTHSVPGKTAALVPEFSMEDLPSAELQPRLLRLQWRICPWAKHSWCWWCKFQNVPCVLGDEMRWKPYIKVSEEQGFLPTTPGAPSRGLMKWNETKWMRWVWNEICGIGKPHYSCKFRYQSNAIWWLVEELKEKNFIRAGTWTQASSFTC